MQYIQFWFANEMPLHVKNSIESLHQFIAPSSEHIIITDRPLPLVGKYTFKLVQAVLSPPTYALYVKCLDWGLPAMASDLLKYSMLVNCKTNTVQLDADIFFLRDPAQLFDYTQTVVFNHHAEITPAAIMAVAGCPYIRSLYRQSILLLKGDVKPHHLAIGPSLATQEFFSHIDSLVLHGSSIFFKYSYQEYIKRLRATGFDLKDLINLLLDVDVVGTHLFKQFDEERIKQPLLDSWSELLKKHTMRA